MTSLAEEVASLSEQLAEYQAAVGDVVRMLGHEGDSPDDLRDAVGQVDALLGGEDSVDRNDLTGLAEQVRRALMLLRDTRVVCERRTAERDEARRERDAVARSLARALSLLDGYGH